jgi:hypothetical protein
MWGTHDPIADGTKRKVRQWLSTAWDCWIGKYYHVGVSTYYKKTIRVLIAKLICAPIIGAFCGLLKKTDRQV